MKEWYCLYQGKLAKGSIKAIKTFLDKRVK